jgi:hypothetical protein
VTRHDLAIYFSVALPLCAIVFFVTRLPTIDYESLGDAFGRLRRLSWRKVVLREGHGADEKD